MSCLSARWRLCVTASTKGRNIQREERIVSKRAARTLDQPRPLRLPPARPLRMVRSYRVSPPKHLVVLLALPDGIAANLDEVVVRDEGDEEVGVDRGFGEGEERVGEVRARSGPASESVSPMQKSQTEESGAHQEVKPFRSRTAGCSQMSSVRSCSIDTKLRIEGRLAGASTGRD